MSFVKMRDNVNPIEQLSHNTLNPLVSVHVITYNQKAYIHETLTSILEQDYNNTEIVVADDGSTDGTAEIILEYAGRYPEKIVPLVGGPNLGITGNSNRGLKACKGKYIAFIGGDDLFLPGKISKQVEWLEKDESRVLCGHQVEVFYETGGESHKLTRFMTSGKGPVSVILNGPPFAATSVMVRASAIPEHGFEERLPTVSDFMLWVECLIADKRYGYIPGTYAKYRKHDNNISNQASTMLADVEKTLMLISARYPMYAKQSRKAMGRLTHYVRGVDYLKNGNKHDAYREFIAALRTNPFYFRAWVRLIQSLKN